MDKKASEQALEFFHAHCNCAQSVYAAACRGGEMTEAQRMAVSAAFGGGMARTGEVCGAVTGALMALGEQAAHSDVSRAPLNTVAQEFMESFRAAQGSIYCRSLTGCRMNTEEGRRKFKETGVRERVCTRLVAFAADAVAAPQEKAAE